MELRDDKDVIFAAVKHDFRAMKYMSDRLKDDNEFICDLIPRLVEEREGVDLRVVHYVSGGLTSKTIKAYLIP